MADNFQPIDDSRPGATNRHGSASSEDSCSEASIEAADDDSLSLDPQSHQASTATLIDTTTTTRHDSSERLSNDLRNLLQSPIGQEVRFRTSATRSTVRNRDGRLYQMLNQYRIEYNSTVGDGRFATVRRVHTANDDAAYALKVLKKSKILQCRQMLHKSSEGSDVAVREVSVLRRIRHRNVVRLVEVIDDPDDDNLYLVFAFCEHGSLMTLPCDKPLSERRAWRHFRDVVDGLEYLHAQSIVHRDLKPENLLLDGEGRIQIADFGSAREFSGEDDAMLNAVGTPAFWPPELLLEEEVCGERAPTSGRAMDLWALGVTLFALMYGRVPFSAQHVERLAEAIRKDKLVFPAEPKISSALRDLLERLLEKDPALRIDMAGIRRHRWFERSEDAGNLVE